ncbi:MAG: CPBP family intramembrane glutamic endopeptidase [Bryobacteraceae bacterium]
MQFLLDIFLDQERRLRTVWRLLIYGIGFFGVMLIVQIGLAIGLVVYFLVANPGGTKADFFQDLVNWIQSLEREQTWVLMSLATPPTALALYGVTLICRLFLDRRSARSIGYCWPERGLTKSIWGGLIWGALPILAAIAIPWALGMYSLERVSLPFTLVVMTPTLVIAAFDEEFVFRGYLLQNFLDVRRPVLGVVFSSLLFWLLHSLNPAAWSSPLVGVNLFGAGVVLALPISPAATSGFPPPCTSPGTLRKGCSFRSLLVASKSKGSSICGRPNGNRNGWRNC